MRQLGDYPRSAQQLERPEEPSGAAADRARWELAGVVVVGGERVGSSEKVVEGWRINVARVLAVARGQPSTLTQPKSADCGVAAKRMPHAGLDTRELRRFARQGRKAEVVMATRRPRLLLSHASLSASPNHQRLFPPSY